MTLRLLAAFLVLAPLIACAASAAPYPTLGSIVRLDPRLDALVPRGEQLEVLAKGFEWTEGPVWVSSGSFLLFSDIPHNVVNRWREGEDVAPFLKPSGYTSPDKPKMLEPGSNGLVLDPQGRLVLCQHGDRRVARMDAPLSAPAAKFTILAERFEGKRLNSPNDLVFHSSGALYFTDPPYGLEKQNESDPAKELDFQGVYRLAPDGTLALLTRELSRPNGIAFSPDEKTLYVANSDPARAVWMAFDVRADGTIANGRVLFDATKSVGKYKGLPDGLKVDRQGNLFATGPGGVLVLAPDGTQLGLIYTGEATSNCAWGDDGSSLYITADMYLVRIRTTTKGKGF